QPKLDLEILGNKTQQNFVGFPIPGTNGVLKQASEFYNSSLKAEWEIDIWGRYRAGTSAAIAGHQAAQQDERAAQTSLAAQVARGWFALVEANEQVDLAAEAIKANQDTQNAL